MDLISGLLDTIFSILDGLPIIGDLIGSGDFFV
ncbi:hypothetical protein EV681_3098 [Advenella incenata]|uniref:Uncharacterized protein n=1 Tax=Advenella incenata TaxID=267800 RepID=A0A4Q7VEM0_9BURK|nr:hypothetical protein EV681_3098 [Advenella incenata]